MTNIEDRTKREARKFLKSHSRTKPLFRKMHVQSTRRRRR